MTVDPTTRPDYLRTLLTRGYEMLVYVASYLYSLLAYQGQVGNVYLNVDHIGQAHGRLIVRRSIASAYQSTICFRVDNPRALDPQHITGATIQRIISAALLEGLRPVHVVINGKQVHYYDRAFEIARQDVVEGQYGRAYFPQRVATPEEAGRVFNPSSIIFRSP